VVVKTTTQAISVMMMNFFLDDYHALYT